MCKMLEQCEDKIKGHFDADIHKAFEQSEKEVLDRKLYETQAWVCKITG